MIKGKPIKNEKGITLVALLVTILILVILASVAIKSIIGNDSLIKQTETVAEDYTVKSYKEQIREKVNSTITKHAVQGEEIGLEQIAKELEEESTWVKTAKSTINASNNNNDILVTVVEGYIYEVYYDSMYGAVFVEYCGTEKGGVIPNLKAEHKGTSIELEASITSGKIERVDEIYRGEIIDSKQNPTGKQTFSANKTGWYMIRAVSNEGKIRYAWLRTSVISDKLVSSALKIEVTPNSPDGNNRWYKTEPKVLITANSTVGEKLCYLVSGAMQEGNIDTPQEIALTGGNASKEIQITKVGYTRITAWIEGDGEKQSQEVTEIVKFDNTSPYITVDRLEPVAEYGQNGWVISKAEVKIEAEDTGSGVMGFTYEVIDLKKNKNIKESQNVIDIDVPIKIETDGEYSIKINLIDNAGNNKNAETIEIKKDEKAPSIDQIMIDKSTVSANSLKVYVTAGDETSGVEWYEYYLNGGEEPVVRSHEGVAEITGLTPKDTQNVYVKVIDYAGNSEKSNTAHATTKGDLRAPNITFDRPGDNVDTYYKNKVIINIDDAAEPENSSGAILMYSTDGVRFEETIGTHITLTVEEEREYHIIAYLKDLSGASSSATKKTITIDKTAPNKAEIEADLRTVTTVQVDATARGEDAFSGVYSYTFQKSLTGNEREFETVEEIEALDSNVCNYTYKTLTPGEKNYLRVIVKDRAGNTSISNVTEVLTHCATSLCEGPFTEDIPCTKCKGTGLIQVFGSHSATVTDGRWNHDGPATIYCENCNKNENIPYGKAYFTWGYKCSQCGQTGSMAMDRWYTNDIMAKYATQSINRKSPGCRASSSNATCTLCKGTKIITVASTCSHGESSTHYTCPHYTVCDFTSHVIEN